MTRRKKIMWNNGDVFLVPISDGNFSVGQILDLRLPHCVRCAFYNEISDGKNVDINNICIYENIISLVEVFREKLDYGEWKIIGNKSIEIPKEKYPNEYYRKNNLAGSITYTPGLVEGFLNAFYALAPWDDWHNPNFLDEFLVDKSTKPTNLIYTKHTNNNIKKN